MSEIPSHHLYPVYSVSLTSFPYAQSVVESGADHVHLGARERRDGRAVSLQHMYTSAGQHVPQPHRSVL